MLDPLTVLPARVLHARPPIIAPWHPWNLLGCAVILGIIVYGVGWALPGVMTDGMVRSAAVPILGGHLVEKSCDSVLFMNLCNLTLSAPGPSGLITRSVSYVFGSNTTDFAVRVIGDPTHPAWLTTDLGLDYFWDRVMSLLMLLTIAVALLSAAMAETLRTARLRAWWHKVAMVPAPLTLVGVKPLGWESLWTVRSDSGIEVDWRMPGRAKPFVLGPENRILGLVHDGGHTLMPLDSKLKWVALSGAERAAALGWLSKA